MFFRFTTENNDISLGLWLFYKLFPDEREEELAYISFTPEAGKIYCLEPIKMWTSIYDNNKTLFLDRQACEKFFLDNK